MVESSREEEETGKGEEREQGKEQEKLTVSNILVKKPNKNHKPSRCALRPWLLIMAWESWVQCTIFFWFHSILLQWRHWCAYTVNCFLLQIKSDI